MPTARKYDGGGLGFEVADNPISRVGVFPYTKRSIGFPGWESDPNGIVNVYRPEEELSDPATVASARLQPWIDDHTMLGDPAFEAGLTAPEQKGVHGTIGEQVYYDKSDRQLKGNLRLWSSSLHDAIEAGKKELSMGYRCVYEFVSGLFEGVAYQAIQRKMRFNHIAQVQQGRMGPGVAVLDHMTFTFDSNDLRELKPMKTTRRVKTAKLLGCAVDALPKALGLDGMDDAAMAKWNAAMDAEEDDAPAAGPVDIINACAETVAQLVEPMNALQESLGSLAIAPVDPTTYEGDEAPVLDAAGKEVIDPATGKPKMKKKDIADNNGGAASIGAADAALKVMKLASKNYHTALDGKAVPAPLVAFDAAIVKAEDNIKTIRAKRATAPNVALDAALARVKELETQLATKTTTDGKDTMTPKEMMATIAAADAMYKKVSPFVGAFDHAAMTEQDIAKYAAEKLELKTADGSEVVAVNAYLHNRPVMDAAARPASSFALDASVKTSSKALDFIAGKEAA